MKNNSRLEKTDDASSGTSIQRKPALVSTDKQVKSITLHSLSMQSNKSENGEWISPGQTVTIADEKISGGMIYVGTFLSAPDGSVDPCLLDISKPVSLQGEYTRKKISKFPSYSDISKEARRTYINWLSGNRCDSKIDIGYVFLFLSGLERRVIFDWLEDKTAQSEWSIVVAEINRLLNIYSKKSITFASCAVKLLNWILLTNTIPSNLYKKPLPFFSKTFDLPLYVQIALGQAAIDKAPISKELALAWVRLDPAFNQALPDVHRTEHFDNLFMLNYEKNFNVGILIPKSKTKLEYIYKPSSVAWRNFREMRKIFVELPDVTKSIISIKKLREIVDIVGAELHSIREEKKQREKPFSNATAPTIPREHRVVLVDGSCFQYPEYEKLPTKRHGIEPISDIYNLVMVLSKDIPAEYVLCMFRDSMQVLPNESYSDGDSIRTESMVNLLQLLGWNVLKVPPVEIRTIIAMLSVEAVRHGKKVEVCTTDVLLTQCVNEHVSIINPINGKRLDLAGATTEFSVPPNQLVDLWALAGNKKELISGLYKVGKQTAIKLLTKYGTLKNVIENLQISTTGIGVQLRNSKSRLESSVKILEIKKDFDLSKSYSSLYDLSRLHVNVSDAYSLATFYSEIGWRQPALNLALESFESLIRNQLSNRFCFKNNKNSNDFRFVVYRIKNRISKKVYFGSTEKLEQRWTTHKREMKNRYHSNINIRDDINRLGIDCFEFKVLSRHSSRQEMLQREQLYILMFYGRNCYNYAKFVEMEVGLPSAMVIGVQREDYWERLSKKSKLANANGLQKVWGLYLSIHAASKDIGISKNEIKSALLLNLQVVKEWRFSVSIEIHPNKIDTRLYKKSLVRPANRIQDAAA